MLAWRDMKNPLKGGAEVVTDIYLQGLSQRGHSVVLYSSQFKGSKKLESYHGYTIIRNGGKLGVYFKGLLFAKRHEKEFDLIIDQVNTIPFFTPLLIKRSKRIAFFHQLCLNVWFYESWFSIVGYLLEFFYLKLYWNTRAFVVSESTKRDLIKYACMKDKNILVLENHVDFKPIMQVPKKENAFCFCGRLKKSKRAYHIIKALQYVKNAKLYIIGDGEYKDKLHKLAKKLHLEQRVIFVGYKDRDERNKLMSKCKAIIVTSVREGWGLIVTEANANGTLAITYNVPGLRDANKTGIIVKKNNPKELAKAMNEVVHNDKLMQTLSRKSLEFARSHINWIKNIERLEQWLKNP